MLRIYIFIDKATYKYFQVNVQALLKFIVSHIDAELLLKTPYLHKLEDDWQQRRYFKWQ